MIKAVLFDIGGVLYDENTDQHYTRLAERFDLPLDDLFACRNKYISDAACGRISGSQYVNLIAEGLGVKDKKRFREEWVRIRTEGIVLNKGVEQIVERLKRRYKVGTLTNIIHLHNEIRLGLDVYRHFPIRIISCEVGYEKPDRRIYELALKRLNLSPEEVVFIDDLVEYIRPAREMGFKTILFKDAKQLERELKSLGIEL